MTLHPRQATATLLAAAVLALWATPAHADTIRDQQWHLKYLNIAQAHKHSQGEGITVGVIDSGVDATHPDLAGNVLPGVNVYGSKPADQDEDGHGTKMAGLIAAHGRGENGVLGIAPKAKIVPIRIYEGEHVYAGKLTEGIKWGTEHKLRVLSISLGGGDTLDLEKAVKEALQSDIVIIAGVGNEGKIGNDYIGFPAAYPGVLAVAGTDQNGDHEPTSSYGKGVVLSAPATNVQSISRNGKYDAGTGTSSSAAIVAGVVALVRAKYPSLTATQVVEHLKATAVDKGPTGWDDKFGYGIVDPVAALTKPYVDPSASASASSSGDASDDGTGGLPTAAIGLLIAAALVATAGIVVVAVVIGRSRR